MQSITPVTSDQLLQKGQEPLLKFEISISETAVFTMNFDSGSKEPAVDEILTGASSGATGKVISVNKTGGTWGGGDAAGSISLKECDGCFNDDEDIDGSVQGANALTVNHPDGDVGVDGLVKNGAFVHNIDPPNDWTAGSSALLTTEAGGKVGNCLMITENGGGTPYAYQAISVTPGEFYEFKVFVNAGTNNQYQVKISDYTRGVYIWGDFSRFEVSGDWSTEQSHIFEVPAGCSEIRIFLQQICLQGAGTTFKFDEVSFYKLDDKWIDLRSIDGKDFLERASISLGGAEMTPDPVAADWRATINNPNNIFHPDHPDSSYTDYFHIGRKSRVSLGGKYGGSDYYWHRIVGYMQKPQFSIDKMKIKLNGFDYMQLLADTELRKPSNYWGTSVTKTTLASEEALGAEKYIGADAMDTLAEENDVVGWEVPVDATFASVFDVGAGSTWAGELDLTDLQGHVIKENIATVIAGEKYKFRFWYKKMAGIGGMHVGLYKTGTLEQMFLIENLTSGAWVEEVHYFTATESCNVRMRVMGGANGSRFRIDEISLKQITGSTNSGYPLSDDCNGPYYATIDGEPFYYRNEGIGWWYDRDNNIFYIENERVVEAGLDLVIYYFNHQTPENVIADLMVTAGLYADRAEALNAMDYTPTNQSFEVIDSHTVGENRANQGIAKDEDGNFYVFSHDVDIGGTRYIDVMTKYDKDWNYVDEYKSLDGKVDGGAIEWVFGDGNVIDGKVYIALRGRDFDSAAIAIWDLDLNYESIHSVEGGAPEAIEKLDGYYWIIQFGRGDKKNTIAKYNTSWVHQNTHSLKRGYDGFVWKDGQIYCNYSECRMDIYKFDGSNFIFSHQLDSLGDEGFCLDGEFFYFVGEENNVIWIGTFASNIKQVWFLAGKSALDATKLICERINYRFHFAYNGTPCFNPPSSAKPSGNEDFSFHQSHISEISENQDEKELWNRVVIEGVEEAQPIGKEETMPSKLIGEASDTDSIEISKEHTKTIKNHLFQDQATIDEYVAIYLAARKDPRWYNKWKTPYNPVPLELEDTIRWQERLTQPDDGVNYYGTGLYGSGLYGFNGVVIVRRGILRDIKSDDYDVHYILEKVT